MSIIQPGFSQYGKIISRHRPFGSSSPSRDAGLPDVQQREQRDDRGRSDFAWVLRLHCVRGDARVAEVTSQHTMQAALNTSNVSLVFNILKRRQFHQALVMLSIYPM